MKQRLVWRIVIAGIYLAILFAIGFYAIAHLFTPIVNPVGAILTTIACAIIGLGIAFLYLGNLEVDETSTLWENEQVSVLSGIPKGISYPFHLEKPSIINGTVSGTKGGEYFLTDFFGTSEETIAILTTSKTDFVVIPKIHENAKCVGETGNELIIIGSLSLPPGNYALRFGKHTGEIEASFSLKKTVRKKPHENLYAFGLTLLEVGVPVFITGVISLGFGTFVS